MSATSSAASTPACSTRKADGPALKRPRHLAEEGRVVRIEPGGPGRLLDRPVGGHEHADRIADRMVVSDPGQARSRSSGAEDGLARVQEIRRQGVDGGGGGVLLA